MYFQHFCCCSIHYVKRPGVTLDAGSIIAKLQLDDESLIQRVIEVFLCFFFAPLLDVVIHNELTAKLFVLKLNITCRACCRNELHRCWFISFALSVV